MHLTGVRYNNVCRVYKVYHFVKIELRTSSHISFQQVRPNLRYLEENEINYLSVSCVCIRYMLICSRVSKQKKNKKKC